MLPVDVHRWTVRHSGIVTTVRPSTGRASCLYKIEWWGVGVVACLERGADCLHMVQLMPLHPKTPQTGLPFWYWLTQVVPEKWPLNAYNIIIILSTLFSVNTDYSTPDGEQSIVMSVSVCLCVCVCLYVHDHIFGTTRPIFTNFCVHVTCGSVSILLWWHSDTLHTSVFLWMTLYLLISQGCSTSPPSWSAVHMQPWVGL